MGFFKDKLKTILHWYCYIIQVFIKKRPKVGTTKSQHQTTPNYDTKEYDGIETDDYWFIVDRWFDTSEDDNKIVRELFPTDKKGNPLFVTEGNCRLCYCNF